MPYLILENKNLILFLNLKFNFMKRRGLIFNSRPNKTAMFALGLMLGLCPVSKAWADINMNDSQVVAQAQKKVKGQVVDATGEPLIGVNITVIGGTEGTITDIDGNYTIGVSAGAKLKFSYIGYKDQIIDVVSQTVINVKLQEDSEVLDEVVVVGYGSQKKETLTGAVTVVSDKMLKNKGTMSSPLQAMQGQVPGVTITRNSAAPGDESWGLKLRGSVSANNAEPLIVIDGVAYDGVNALRNINPSDIQSINFLKDASAAIYGSRAAGGVVLVTTKQAKEGKARIEYSGSYTYKMVGLQPELMTMNEWANAVLQTCQNDGQPDSYSWVKYAKMALASEGKYIDLDHSANPFAPSYSDVMDFVFMDTNWQDVLFGNSYSTQHDLAVSGGTEKNLYRLSVGYMYDDSNLKWGNNNNQRFNLRSNITSEMTSWLKGGVNLSFAHSMQNYPVSSDSKTSNVITAGRTMPGFYPIYEMNTDGSYKLDENGDRIYDFGSYRPSGSMANWNLPATLPLDKSERMKDEVSGRTFLEATIIEGLKFKTSFNFDLINYNTLDYTNPQLGPAKENGGGVSRMNTRTFSWTWNNIATYDKTIGEHHFNVLAGVEAYSYRYDELTASRSKMAQPDMPELVVGSQLTGGSGYRIDYALVGYLTQALYDYQNKYFFSASYRRDGSSRFAPETRWGNFWSLGTSWRIDREEFMASTSDWLSALTLKMSYGAQGNDNLGTYYASKGLYTIVSNLGENALVSDRMATPNLKWETNLNFNVGIDFSLFNNRFSGSFDFFTRRSKDLLYSRPIAPSLGYGSIDENVGALKNTGIEMVLNGTIINQNGWVWKLGMNLTHYKNKVTDLPLKDMPRSGVNKLQVGRSVYYFYMIEWAGIDPENGDPLWYKDEVDANKNPTGKRVTTNDYGSADYYYVDKSSLPKVYGGFNTSLSWKGFDLSAIFAYSIGGYIYNRDVTMILHNGSLEGRDWSTEILRRWTPDNRYTDVPALSTTSNNWNSASTRFLQNNSYMRLKNLTLSYNLPKQWISKLSLSSVQVYVQGDNLFTIHRNQGLDPEQGITGITYYRYPAMRTISGGINVSF